MNMKDTMQFEIEYRGNVFLIQKTELNFIDGYAVVEKKVKTSASIFYGDVVLRGIVDKNYETVMEFKGYYTKLKLFPNGNVLAAVRITGGDGEQAYTRFENRHYSINDKKVDLITTFTSEISEFINDTTFKVPNNGTKDGFEALYDIVKRDFISEKFTKIKEFKKTPGQSEEKLAKAILKIKSASKSYKTCDLVCYIDESGKIRTPIYNTLNDSYVETNTSDFNFQEAVESFKNLLDKEPLEESVDKTLLKKLTRK